MKTTRREFTRLCLAGGMTAAMGCSRSERPNVILFYVDDLRATAMKLYNPDAVETPGLSRLASSGTLYEHSYTPHPLCLPARASLWTGQYSGTHGCQHNHKLLKPDSVSMAGLFREAGYSVGLFGKNHCFTEDQLGKWFTVDCSMDSALWKESLSPELARQISEYQKWVQDQGGELMPPSAAPFSHEIYPTHLATERAMEFIEDHRQGPFFLWVSVPEPHSPIEVPERFAGSLPADRLVLPPFREGEIDTKNTRMQIYDYLIRGTEIPGEYLAQYLSVYSGKIAFLDHELGRLLDAIEAKGMRENTIVLFTSDNGDFAGEHHLIVKTGSLLDSMVRMPMLLSWPGNVAEGRREDALVSHVDIMPTLLKLCGLPVPAGVEGHPLPMSPDAPRRSFVYSEYGSGDPEYTWQQARKLGPAERLGDYALKTPHELQDLDKRERAGRLRMIRTHTHKVILDSNGEVEFYDLIQDPNELDNAHGRPEYQQEERRLLQLLEG